jgi:hypothetical protein
MKPLIKHTILPFDYPTDYNEWILQMELEHDKISGTDKVVKMICEQAITDELIEQVNVLLTFSR